MSYGILKFKNLNLLTSFTQNKEFVLKPVTLFSYKKAV